jgi:23S rRNA pseudouridine1911/1915/1917 synthase
MLRLDVALVARHPVLSRRKAREVIEKGQVMVDGALVREPGTAVGDQASIDWDENRRALPRIRARIPLLYEDDTLLVVDKPAGLLSVPSGPGAEGEDTALLRVREYVVRANPRRPFVGVVHRIDRDTSGALLFAKNADMRRALIGLFSRHALERKYLALVVGLPPAESGIVDAPIRDSYAGGRRAVGRLNEPARPARTRWRVVERFPRGALLDVELETGRQHQVRIHLAHIGLPIVGDAVYGAESGGGHSGLGPGRQMLHARSLAFTDPLTGREIRAESPVPDDFATAMRRLRASTHGVLTAQRTSRDGVRRPAAGPRRSPRTRGLR